MQHSKTEEKPIVANKTKEEVLAQKRAQMQKTISKVDPQQLKAILAQ